MRIFLFLSVLSGLFYPFLGFAKPIKITVSVAPIKSIVELIGKEKVDASVVVPHGASPHSYEPTARQTIALEHTNIFFCVGESFEKRLISHLQAVNPKIQIVDLRECIDPLPSSCNCHCLEIDPHLWLSPKQFKKMATFIYHFLSEQDPDNSSFYGENFFKFLSQIEEVENLAQKKLGQLKQRTFITAHAAFGYLARDYHLKQLCLENKGNSATPKTIVNLVREGKKEAVATVLAQPQYNLKGAERIANELDAKIVIIDPYREDALANLQELIFALQS